MNTEAIFAGMTPAQKNTLGQIYNRPADYWGKYRPESYRALCESVQLIIGGGGAVCVPAAGFWIAIEPDGYPHT